jgi:hypothetical protein
VFIKLTSSGAIETRTQGQFRVDIDAQAADGDLSNFSAAIGTKDNTTYYAGSAEYKPAIWSKSLSISAPGAAENLTLWKTPHAITVTGVDRVMQGSSPSVTYAIHYGAARGTSDGTIVASNAATTTGSATLNTASIPSGSYIWLTTSATSGTVDEFHLTINYRH